MPLHVQFIRNGEPMAMPFGFGSWHLGRAYDVASVEGARAQGMSEEEIRANLELPCLRTANMDEVKKIHKFMDIGMAHLSSRDEVVVTAEISFEDPADGEVLTLLPGDRVRMWR